MGKVELRKLLLQQRKNLSESEWQSKSQQICEQMRKLPTFQQAQTVLAYCSFRQEPDLSTLFAASSKTWGLPRCVGQSMVWHIYSLGGLQTGAYGILEPKPELPTLQAEQVDLILVPCVGCDRQNYRLGYGGGFYDRMFAESEWAQIPAIGITFDFGVVNAIDVEPWDRQLTGICTESGMLG